MKSKLLLFAFIVGVLFLDFPALHAQTVLSIVAPSAGQVWNGGTTQTIMWTPNNTSGSTGSSNPNVNINLYPASACVSGYSTSSCATQSTVTPYIIALNIPNTGSYQWSIPSTLPSSYQGPDIITVGLSDSSAQGSGQFTIATSGSNSISQITSPGLGGQWRIGSTQNIQWPSTSSSSIPSVKVELVPNGSPTTTPYIIAANVPNNGSYQWNINATMSGTTIPAGQYTLALIDPATNNMVFSSPGLFTLTSASSSTSALTTISQLSPNSGPIGTQVSIAGSGFASSSNTILFGNGTYIKNINSSNGSSLQFTVPDQTQPCPPDNSGACTMASALLTPGTYNVSVMNASGTSNSLPFTLTGAAGSSTPAMIAGFPDGSLLLATDNPTVYLVKGGILVPFSSAKIFLGWGYEWSQIQVMPPSQLNGSGQSISTIPVPAPVNNLQY